MQIDVFTLLPHAFSWLTEQRPLAAVLGSELDLRLWNYRDFTPLSGGQVDDELVEDLAAEEAFTLLSSRFEGFDERVLEHIATDAVSIGPYVLSGGELPAMVVVEAVARRLPGAMSDESSTYESFSAALGGGLEFPQYTRPAEYRGWRVPEVLLSGDHARIDSWRKEQSRERTLS